MRLCEDCTFANAQIKHKTKVNIESVSAASIPVVKNTT